MKFTHPTLASDQTEYDREMRKKGWKEDDGKQRNSQ